jgi:1,4-dihydroxy-2-naphthoate octaprenyltransferase
MAIVMLGYRPPSPDDDRALALAEQRWLMEAARLKRLLTIAGLVVAAGLVVTGAAVMLGSTGLARLCCIPVFGGMARVIYLFIQRQRRFVAIKMQAGMTRHQALTEFNARSG